MKIPLELLEDFLCDPVMAAKILMGYELDPFQAYRLRIAWWTSAVIDSSGISTGKTLTVNFIKANLRAMLLGHREAVIFQNFAAGEEFWRNYTKACENSYFRNESVRHESTGRLGEKNSPSSKAWRFKSGGEVFVPAPGHAKDAAGLATFRFSDMNIDEWLEVEKMGDSIDSQLGTRITAETFNADHPLWSNHMVLLGHAESPSHKGYVRYKQYKRAIASGSQEHALVSFAPNDATPEFKKRFVKDKVLRNVAMSGKENYARRALGLWERDASNYYDDAACNLARRDISILIRRREVPQREVNYFHGRDTAYSESSKADFSTDFVMESIVCKEGDIPNCMMDGISYRNRFVYCNAHQGIKFKTFSALYYKLHANFGFSKTVMDQGGGGVAVYQEMQSRTQNIGMGEPFEVQPVCLLNDPDIHSKQAILSYFGRGTECDKLFTAKFRSEDGIIAACHANFREAWLNQYFEYPKSLEEIDPEVVKNYTPFENSIHTMCDNGYQQVVAIRNLSRNGEPLVSSNGYLQFETRKKKDLAYAAMYCWTAFLIHHHDRLAAVEEDELSI